MLNANFVPKFFSRLVRCESLHCMRVKHDNLRCRQRHVLILWCAPRRTDDACASFCPFSFNNVVDAYGKDGQLARSLVQGSSNATEIAGVVPRNEVGYFVSAVCCILFLHADSG